MVGGKYCALWVEPGCYQTSLSYSSLIAKRLSCGWNGRTAFNSAVWDRYPAYWYSFASSARFLFFGESASLQVPVVCDTDVQPDFSEDSSDVFRKRLTSSLVVPDEAKQSKLDPAWRKPRVTDALQVLDVSQLSLEQRVLVQLNGIGLISSSSSNVQVRGCRGRFTVL